MTTHIIKARNVHEALTGGIQHLLQRGVKSDSRNGEVLVAPGPVVTEYTNPQQHVLLSPTRDANPFFHLMEALWMLAGRNDLTFPMKFNKRFAEYSDDGETIHGAYGYRWRNYFEVDQLDLIVEELTENPKSRRAVLSHWAVAGDLEKLYEKYGGLKSKDVPCNTHVYFQIVEDKLDMAVCCRSNDIVWGCYGANVVHFSLLQEYMAIRLGIPQGTYYQFSNNFHVYTGVFSRDKLRLISDESADRSSCTDTHVPLRTVGHEEWMCELNDILYDDYDQQVYNDFFMKEVALPMRAAWDAFKAGNYKGADYLVDTMIPSNWKTACAEWLKRREVNRGKNS